MMYNVFQLTLLFLIVGLGSATGSSAERTWTDDGFLVPDRAKAFEFPRGHGSHPDYKIEWWYLTGHLACDETGRRFGYQATFFRTGAPLEGRRGDSHFGDADFYMAHMALTEVDAGIFHYEERLNRDGWDANASTETLDVRNGNWRLVMIDPDTETMRLDFSVRGDIRVSLELTPEKPLIRFGEDGLSRKGEHPQAVSYYLSFSRIRTSGEVRIGGRPTQVTGISWMDHEIASRQLSSGLEGWDWTAIHLDDGTEIKAYILRREDGTADPFSRFMTIDENNNVVSVGPEGFTWERLRWWKSPATGHRYPVEIHLSAGPEADAPERVFHLRPLLDAQEISGELGGIPYWEGACEVLDAASGARIGLAYVELAGYAGSLGERLR